MEPIHPKKLIVPKQPSLVMTTSHYYKAVMMAYGISHFYAFEVEEDVHDILSIVPDGCVDFLFRHPVYAGKGDTARHGESE